ncbi:hypothetical protein FHS96_002588 [Sphingomonas zeicaulis]|uniref:lasso peptide biosynthesis B2 protein n=1 Tax=Sphingomonas zeicaulis TaxID=1632740 RepID=UPI003D1AC58E
MLHCRLAPHLSFCEVSGRLIFLDLRQDRYFQLGNRSARRFREIIARGGMVDPDDDLVARDILVPGDGSDPAACQVVVPERSMIEAHAADRRGRLSLSAGLGIVRTAAALRRGPLDHLVGRLQARQAGMPADAPADSAKLTRLIATFEHTRAWVPIPRVCLIDGLALLDLLLRNTVAARLVFGVKLDPFAAHCWVQSDTTILNDAVDHARNFTPIFVL